MLLYHYCSNETMYNIVKHGQLWMSDISKSNDYSEMRIFKPGIFFSIEEAYKKRPFPFLFKGLNDLDAIRQLLIDVEKYIDNAQNSGFLTSFVICFSEEGDMLSQWRGYANNGKGCSLGFSLNELQQYCQKHENQIVIKKVEYINKDTLTDYQNSEADKLLTGIRDLRQDASQLFSSPNLTDKQLEEGIFFLALSLFENFIYNTLQYKWDAFKEEQEWRMFFKSITKDEETLFGETKDLPAWKQHFDVDYRYLHNIMDFYAKDDCLVPYYPINMIEISKEAIKQVILGPKNTSYKQDVRLLFFKEGMGKPIIDYSNISYR